MRALVVISSVLCMLSTGACQPAPGPTVEPGASAGPEPAAATDASTDDAADADECDALPPRDEAIATYEDGRTRLEAARMGEHYDGEALDAALARLREAGLAGHLEAQFLFGSTRFSTMFMEGPPQPEQREAYTDAIMLLHLAGTSGHERAKGYLPGIDGDAPPTEQMPLSQVPAEWLDDAWQGAAAWSRCHGAPWSDATPPS